MANLTQEQIDALFVAAEEGRQISDKEIFGMGKKEDLREYDFNRPDKFKPENLRSLRSIAESFSRGFSQFAAASMRVDFQVNVIDIEQIPYESEYISKIPKNSYIFCVVDFGDAELGKMIMEFDVSLALPIHRRMMGRKNLEVEEKRKELTEIEIISLTDWVENLLFPQFKESFKNVADLNPQIAAVEKDAQYAKITTTTDMVALISFEVMLGKRETLMRFCIPFISIEPIIQKLTTENVYEFKMVKGNVDEEQRIKNHIKTVKKKIDIELGKSAITFKELVQLSVNDVLTLDKNIDEPLVGYIDNIPKFSAVMGKQDHKIAVKITGFVEKGDDVVVK